MQIREVKRAAATALLIPNHAALATLPAGLATALAADAERPCRLQTLGLIPQPLIGRLADGPAEALALRRRAAALGRLCAGDAHLVLQAEAAWSAADLCQVLLGLQEGLYGYLTYKSEPAPSCSRIDCLGVSAAQRPGLERGRILGEAMRLARDLINCPAEDLGPVAFVKRARQACRGSGLALSVLDAAACKRRGMGCLLAVGRSGREAPRMLVVDWPGVGKQRGFEAICGKGVCFDTGGLNLKPDKSMLLMRKDMGGAGTVLGAMLATARLKTRRRLRAYIPLVENAVGPDAFRPGDILTAMDGTTVEVGNTDAEGRLILADAICLARTEGAASICTVATLTGAALVALGRIHVPVMGDDEPVARLVAGAGAAGEKCWRLPLDEEHRAIMNGLVADLRNDGNGEAGCITAGAFLKHFAGDVPFVHADISPASWQMSNGDRLVAGATGAFLTTLVHAYGDGPADG